MRVLVRAQENLGAAFVPQRLVRWRVQQSGDISLHMQLCDCQGKEQGGSFAVTAQEAFLAGL